MQGLPYEALYDILIRLFLVVNDTDRHVLAGYGLSLPRFHILQHLDREPGSSFARLGDLMLTDRANVSRLIRGMEADGLVSRQLNSEDRRSYLLHLTSKGKDVCGQVAARHREDITTRFARAADGSSLPFSADFIAQLHTLCQGLEAHLETIKHPAG